MFSLFNSIKDEYPMEKFILKVLHDTKYDINATTDVVYNKYPFTKKHDLKKVIAELVRKKISNEKIGGVWVKLKNKFKMVALNYMDLAHDAPPAWDNSSKCGTEVGRANRFEITPQGHNGDRYEIPKLDEVEDSNEVQIAFKNLKHKFANTLPGIDEIELDRVVKEEMKRLGFDLSHLAG
jgi:hypothetical protein